MTNTNLSHAVDSVTAAVVPFQRALDELLASGSLSRRERGHVEELSQILDDRLSLLLIDLQAVQRIFAEHAESAGA